MNQKLLLILLFLSLLSVSCENRRHNKTDKYIEPDILLEALDHPISGFSQRQLLTAKYLEDGSGTLVCFSYDKSYDILGIIVQAWDSKRKVDEIKEISTRQSSKVNRFGQDSILVEYTAGKHGTPLFAILIKNRIVLTFGGDPAVVPNLHDIVNSYDIRAFAQLLE